MVSTLSTILKIRPASVLGKISPAKRGKYCSKIASPTAGVSPSSRAYSLPIIPCNSVNSLTIPVVKSVLARCVARSKVTVSVKPTSCAKAAPNVKRRSVLSFKLPKPSWKTIFVNAS